MHPGRPIHHSPPRALLYIRRALHLRCPECGVSPIFVPLHRTRSIDDWFRPLDGCPRCGYAYEREDGYFLLAIWGVNYGIVAGLGLILGFCLDRYLHFTLFQQILTVVLTMPLLSFALARHAKALFLALDHYYDPHVRKRKP